MTLRNQDTKGSEPGQIAFRYQAVADPKFSPKMPFPLRNETVLRIMPWQSVSA
jgi:hypothetical protein